MTIRCYRVCWIALIALLSLADLTAEAAGAAKQTTTILNVTSNDTHVTSVAAGTVVTLTASVTSRKGEGYGGATKLLRCRNEVLHRYSPPRRSAVDKRRDRSVEVRSRHRESQLQGGLWRNTRWDLAIQWQCFRR